MDEQKLLEILKKNLGVLEVDGIEIFTLKAIKGDDNVQDSTITHYISTNDLDRGRDIVNPKGMISVDFQKSPTVLFMHNYSQPIGRSLWQKKEANGVLVKTQFSKSTQFAQDIFNLHKEGILNSWSIGFSIPRGTDGKILKGAIEYDEEKDIRTINKWALHEYSSVSVAMNPDALDVAKGLVKSDAGNIWLMKQSIDIQVAQAIEGFGGDINALKEAIKAFSDNNEINEELIQRVDCLEEELLSVTQSIVKKEKVEISVPVLDLNAKSIVSRGINNFLGKQN